MSRPDFITFTGRLSFHLARRRFLSRQRATGADSTIGARDSLARLRPPGRGGGHRVYPGGLCWRSFYSVYMALSVTAEFAYWGHFQFAFALLSTQINDTLYLLLKARRREAALEAINRRSFGRNVQAILELLKEGPMAPQEETPRIIKALEVARSVADWRNDRIHALLRSDETGTSLCKVTKGDKGIRLGFDLGECEEMHNMAIAASMRLKAYGNTLASHFDSHNMMLQKLEGLLPDDI